MSPMYTYAYVVVALTWIIAECTNNIYVLHKVDTKKFPNALCLDGSPGAFWFNKVAPSLILVDLYWRNFHLLLHVDIRTKTSLTFSQPIQGTGSGTNKFIIHHQGGAWCTSPRDCVERSRTDQGSSTTWEHSVNCDFSKGTHFYWCISFCRENDNE